MASLFTVAGRGFSGAGQNVGLAFVKLRDWDLRPRADLKVTALVGRAMAKFSQFRNAQVFAFPPPAVLELGRAGGFDFQLQDRAGLGHEAMMAARNQMLGLASQDPRLVRVRPSGLEDVAQYRIDVDWEKAGALGVPINSIHHTIPQPSAVPMSTTSSRGDGSSGSMSRPTPLTACCPKTWSGSMSAMPPGR